MQLGSSMRRRRGKGEGEPPRGGGRRGDGPPPERRGPRSRLALTAAGVSAVGLASGWLLATRVLFPPPPPPGDLYEVPDLYGAMVDEAGRRLEQAGLALGEAEQFRHPSADSGRVVGQDPLPGQLARPGLPVRVSYSMGVERRLVPDVSQLRGERARVTLEAAGFMVALDSAQSDQPRGSVVALEPPAGTSLPVPGEVRLVVSTGPPEVIVPALVGRREGEARDTLQALGFLVTVVEELEGGGGEERWVVAQDPPAERTLARGAAVRLVIAQRPPQPDTVPGG